MTPGDDLKNTLLSGQLFKEFFGDQTFFMICDSDDEHYDYKIEGHIGTFKAEFKIKNCGEVDGEVELINYENLIEHNN